MVSNINLVQQINDYELVFGVLTDNYPFDSSVNYSSNWSNLFPNLTLNTDGTFDAAISWQT